MDKHLEVAVVHFQVFERSESLENMLLLLQPLWKAVLSLVHAKGNKDDRSAQAVQDEAATRAGFSAAPSLQAGNAHGSHSMAATIRPPEVRMAAITRESLCWDDCSDKSEREGTFQRQYPLRFWECKNWFKLRNFQISVLLAFLRSCRYGPENILCP